MKAGVITIGDELLLGQTINTNLAKIGMAFGEVGVSVIQSCTIMDSREGILEVLDNMLSKFELVVITGGLGPTNDDVTKEVLTEYFQSELILNEEVLAHIRNIFESKGRVMVPSNIDQAKVPKDCEILWNPLGTAPGMWFEKQNKIVISLPGVPYEMENLLKTEVIPKLKSISIASRKYYRTIMTQGIGESFLAEKISDWENRIYKDGMSLAYLPSPGMIRLRITTENKNKDKEKIDAYIKEITDRLPQYVYANEDVSIFQIVGELLKEEKATLSTVESCTAGGIANAFTAFSGSSTFFKGGFITYSNTLKMKLANVTAQSLDKYGAVSEQMAKEMAIGGRKELETDYCISVTGIAGPTGGSEEKPVGTVWIAVASSQGVVTEKFILGNDRGRNIQRSILCAANVLRRVILGITRSNH